MATGEQHIVFRLKEEVYALHIMHIQEIIKMKDICETPNSARPYLKGVINVRGNIIPVISLSERFGKVQQPASRKTRIIITKLHDQFVGILADEIMKVDKLEHNPLPETVSDKVRETAKAISYAGNTIIPVLDLSHVLEIGSEGI